MSSSQILSRREEDVGRNTLEEAETLQARKKKIIKDAAAEKKTTFVKATRAPEAH